MRQTVGIVFAGFLLAVGLAFSPIKTNTAYAAECVCSGSTESSERATCQQCVESCASSGGMSRYGTTSGTSCRSDGTVEPTPVALPETLPATDPTGRADPSLCSAVGSNPLSQIRCYFLIVIAEILLFVASFLGKVLVFLVDIMIAFASYNDFGSAIVVQKGWVIVRDIVNMFFIIVLLVSAFSSIIGYEESFHYKRVLPKLLLMAILINFSRTLIQLLVDFSQVMMLTFVNAFAQAGPGNLVAALKMDSVLQMAPPGGGSVEGVQSSITGTIVGNVDPINIILALMLAVFMLSIALGVVVIMTAYLIFRIVGLWIALILSPIALFATALPGKLQKAVDPFTGKYWSRLSALLTGGPVMAFFLWLTFAITQEATGGEGGLSQAVKISVSNPETTFLSTIGNSQDIASFIVGITLLLMGLDAAVSTAGAVSESLGKFSKRVSSASQALGKLAATSPFLLGYAGARYVDRRADISGRAATGLAATVGQVPGLRGILRKPLTAAMTRNKRLDLEEAKGLQEGQQFLSTKQRAIMAAATPSLPGLATKGQRMAYAQQQMERAGKKNSQAIKDEILPSYVNQMTMQRQNELKAQGLSGKALKDKMKEDEGMIKNRAGQFADRDVAARQALFLDKARSAAESAGDQDMMRSIDDQLKENPQLALDRAKQAKKLVADPSALNKMSSQAKGDVAVLYQLLDASGAVQKDAEGKVSGFDRAKLDGFMDKITDKDLKGNLEMVTKLASDSYVKDANGKQQGYTPEALNNLAIGKDEKGKSRMLNMPIRGAGKSQLVASEIERAVAAIPGTKRVTGVAYGPEAMLGAGGSTEVVLSERGKQAKEALLASPGTAAVGAVDRLGFKDTVELGGAPAYDQVRQEMGRQIASGDMSLMSSFGKEIKSLNGQQQTDLIAEGMVSDLLQKYIDERQAGRTTKSHDEAFKNIVEVSASIDADIKKTGRAPLPDSSEARVQQLISDVRAKLNSKDQAQRRELPGTLRYVVQEKET